jgi:hypothetical protein
MPSALSAPVRARRKGELQGVAYVASVLVAHSWPCALLAARAKICLTCTTLVWPAAWISRMIGRTLAANCGACALRATRMRSTASRAP